MSSGSYEIYAIKYGFHDRRAADNFIGGDPHDRNDPINFYVWAIVGDGRTIVVDTGFDQPVAKKRGRTITKPIGEGLKALGLAPDAVDDIIITHMHYDHAGNADLFPRARYHLQDCEMEYATGRCMCHNQQRAPFECDYVVDMVRKVYAGRVTYHDGSAEIAPGVTVHKIGGHSKGLQCVTVNTARGRVVLASDCAHLNRHLDEGRVFPITYNVGDVLEGYNTLKKLAPSRAHIVPGHDPLVMDLYPAAKVGLEGWVARLDVAPKAP